MDFTKRKWELGEYTQAWVDAYKRRGEFETITIHHLGRDFEIQYKQHPRILYYEDGAIRPNFINDRLVSVPQWWYFCAVCGYDIPTPVDYPNGDPLQYPISNISAIDVCNYYDWMNAEYGFPQVYDIRGTTINQLHDGCAFITPNAREQLWILDKLPQMSDEQISEYCWHRNNSGGQMQPLGTEKSRYFSKYQRGTLMPDGTFTENIGQSGPAGNLYWIAMQSEEFEDKK